MNWLLILPTCAVFLYPYSPVKLPPKCSRPGLDRTLYRSRFEVHVPHFAACHEMFTGRSSSYLAKQRALDLINFYLYQRGFGF